MTAEIIDLQRPLLVNYRKLTRAAQTNDHSEINIIIQDIILEAVGYIKEGDLDHKVASMIGFCAAILPSKTECFHLLMGLALKVSEYQLKEYFNMDFKREVILSYQAHASNRQDAYLIPGLLSYAWLHEASVYGRPSDKHFLDMDDFILYAAMHDELTAQSSLVDYWLTIGQIDLQQMIYKVTPLMVAARAGAMDTLNYLLKDIGVNVNFKTPENDNAFSFAISHHKVLLKALNLLTIYGVDIHHIDNEGKNAYFYVASYPFPRLDVIKWLDFHKLDMTLRDNRKRTILMNALMLHNIEISKYIIENHWHDINAQDELGMTAMMLYIKNFGNDMKFIQFLIEKGADTDIKNQYGRTIVDLVSACKIKEQENLARFLKNYQEEGVLNDVVCEKSNVIQFFAKR